MPIELAGPIVLAGAGKMGSALLSGWLGRGVPADKIVIQEPNLTGEAASLARDNAIVALPALDVLAVPPAIIVAAVKPQVMADVFAKLARHIGPDTLVLSIAAGRPIASFEAMVPGGTAVVRAMPNTPAAIGRAITGAVANARVTSQQKALADELLRAVGDVVWLPDETLIDAVTAVSGSGPAYVFLLAEAMAEAGVAAGLDATTAMRLACATVSGAGELLRQSGIPPSTLRENVTSPGGTTAAALSVLMQADRGLAALIEDAVLAAKKRGRELGG